MKKIFSLIGLAGMLAGLLAAPMALAQENKAIIKGERKLAEVGKQIIFEAGDLSHDPGEFEQFHWNFGDGGSAEGVGVLHSYLQTGFYEVTMDAVKNGETAQKYSVDVYVYDKLIVGVVDHTADMQRIADTEQYIFDHGSLFWVIGDDKEARTVDEVADQVIGNKDILNRAKGMVVWGAGNFGLDLLAKLASRSDIDYSGLNIAVVSSGRLGGLTKTALSAYSLINSNSLILIGDNALDLIIDLDNIDTFVDQLELEAMDYELIGIKDVYRADSVSGWMLMTRMVGFAMFKGVPLSTIALILLLPIVAMLIVVARQVVGIKAFGIYVPSLITLAFLESGLRYGTVVFLVVLAVGTLARLVLRRLRLLYLPRMALILTTVSLGLLLMMAGAAYFDLTGLKTLSIVPLLTMVILTEKFVAAQIRYGFGSALRLTLETFILSMICYFLVGWESLKVFVVSYPEWILLSIPILILLGRWTGLRLFEYWRFKRLMK